MKNCDACKYYREGVGGLCVRECGADEFIDVANDPSVCLPCNSHCHGCAGPTHADCTKCKHYTIYDDLGIGEQDAEEDAADAEPLPVGTGRRFLAILAQFCSHFPFELCWFWWLGSQVVSVLDSGSVGPVFKSQLRRCRVTVLGKLFTPIVPLFTDQRNW